MAKNFEDFVSKYNGTWNDVDGAYGAQCVDGFNVYVMWGGHSRISGNAWDIGSGWQSNGLSSYCKNVTGQQYKNGDICFWDGTQFEGNPYGHVSMYYNGQYFGQNQGDGANGTTGKAFNIMGLVAPRLVLRPNFVGKPDIYITCVNGLITKLVVK